MKKHLFIFLFGMIAFSVQAQYAQVKADTIHNYSLLENPYVQMEATEAINSMYNFQFDRSLRHFNYLKKQYAWHPLPYFMMGLNYWWRIVPDFKNEEFDEPFMAYMDSSIVLGERLYEKYNKVEGAFFLAAAYAFKGRLYSDRGEYTKAAFAGKDALKYLEECRGKEDLSPELLFGDALFNYYAEWVPENYPMLKPLMLMFPDGDKKLGIEQLKKVARNAFYTRTEAQYYLMRISYFEENDLSTALQTAEYLHETFPGNAYFHRFYARLLYQSGKYSKAIPVSMSILNRIDSMQVGYEYNSGRYASYFLGHIYELKKDYTAARKYLKLAKEYGEAAEATDKGYYIYSVLRLARIEEREGNYEEAKAYYTRVKKVTKRKEAANKEARAHLKNL
ncbi:MAG: tol-pal system protein YbgF [Cyclobacteriaceae bacterium]